MVNTFSQPHLFIDTAFLVPPTTATFVNPLASMNPDNLSIADLVAIVLAKIIDGNQTMSPNDVSNAIVSFLFDDHSMMRISSQDIILQDPFVKFQSSYEPEIPITSYLERIRKYSKCSDSCFVLMLIYMDRLIEKKGLVINRLNIHRLLITGMMIAAKYHDDLFYNNAWFARLGGVSLPELNVLELEVLTLLDYSMFVSNVLYEKYSHQLYNYKFMIHSPTTVSVPPPIVFGTEINWSQTYAIPPNGPGSAVFMSPLPTGNCMNAFQFSPNFLAPHYSTGNISPCGNASVSSVATTRSAVSCYGGPAPTTFDNSGNKKGPMNVGNQCVYPFSRAGSVDSIVTTTTSASPDRHLFGYAHEPNQGKVLAYANSNNMGYQPVPCHGGQAQMPHQDIGGLRKTVASRPYFHHPYGGGPLSCAPQQAAVVNQAATPNLSFPSFVVPMAPVQANYYPAQSANPVYQRTTPPPLVPVSQGKTQNSFVKPLSASKKRAHNDLCENGLNNNVAELGNQQSFTGCPLPAFPSYQVPNIGQREEFLSYGYPPIAPSSRPVTECIGFQQWNPQPLHQLRTATAWN